METQAQTVTAITAAVDETALAADSMSNTIAAIREDTETVASEIDNVGQGFDALDGRLGSLKHSAADFVAKVAACAHGGSRHGCSEAEADPARRGGRGAPQEADRKSTRL